MAWSQYWWVRCVTSPFCCLVSSIARYLALSEKGQTDANLGEMVEDDWRQ